MQYLEKDLGFRRAGEVVKITLSGNQANVRLMDFANLNNYKCGTPYQFRGGKALRSPLRMAIPHDGHFHVVIDMQGLGGSVNASVQVV